MKYTEIDEQMLQLNFHLLTEFVEIQSAWMNIICDEEKWSALPWWTRIRLALGGTFRSRAQGLEYLRWEGDQVDECGAATTQATNAQTTLRLYHWWTVARLFREDPWAMVKTTTYWIHSPGKNVERPYSIDKRVNAPGILKPPRRKKIQTN